MTQRFVDEERLGLLGICAAGGYAVHAALTEHRYKATGTVVASDIGRPFRQLLPPGGLQKLLKELGHQRTAEARGEKLRRDPWIPDTLEEAKEKQIKDPDLLQAIELYRESAYRHPNSTNRLLFRCYSHLLNYDGFHLVPELLTHPLQVIVTGRCGNTGQYENGKDLFKASPSAQKDFLVVEGAGHYDMYYNSEYVDQAIRRLAPFYERHMS